MTVSLFLLVVLGVLACVLCVICRLQGRRQNFRLNQKWRDRQNNYNVDIVQSKQQSDLTSASVPSTAEGIPIDIKTQNNVFSIDVEKDVRVDSSPGKRQKKGRLNRLDSKTSINSRTMDGDPPLDTAMYSNK